MTTKAHVCPHCGYCDHCGKANRPYVHPYPVYPYGWWWNPPYQPYVITTTSQPLGQYQQSPGINTSVQSSSSIKSSPNLQVNSVTY